MRLHPGAKNLADQRFGRLVAVEPVGVARYGGVLWLCRCDCGKTKSILSGSLRRGVRSCGCANRDTAHNRAVIRKLAGANRGTTYAIAGGEHVYRTKSGWSKAVLRANPNGCVICGWREGKCDTHHRILRSKGGQNTIANGVVLCPNHHRLVHEGKIAV